MASRLFERFVATARAAYVPLAVPLLQELDRRLTAAELATPDVAHEPDEYCARLIALLAAALDPLFELSQLHVEDMYLAWALGTNDRSAFARFEREFLARLALQVASGQREIRADLEQNVRTRLFIASGDSPARIHQYSGRGPFGAWLRMVGKRAALDLLRARGAAPARELDSPNLATDPELDYLKLRYASDFKTALEHALLGLDARQVTLLKLSFIEQVSAAAVGVMYGVSGRTVQRWLAELRQTVLTRTREGLKARLALSPSELDSLLGLMQSQLHVTLQRVLDAAERAQE